MHGHGRSLVLDQKWTGERHEAACRDSDALSGGRRPLPIPLRQSKPRGKSAHTDTEADRQARHLEQAICGKEGSFSRDSPTLPFTIDNP